MMTANEAREITNKVKEDNTNSAMEKIIDKSEEKIKDAAEAGLTYTIVEVKIWMIDEDALTKQVYSYFKHLGYKPSISIYDYGNNRYIQITISWEE